MSRLIAACVLLFVPPLLMAQVKSSSKLVKAGSFLQAAEKFKGALDHVLGVKSDAAVPAPQGTATRKYVLQYLESNLTHFQPFFQTRPRPVKFDLAKLKRQNPGVSAASAERLVRWGLVPVYSPLVTSAVDGLTAEEVGEVLGYFYSRVCTLTHKAIPEFTPDLMPEGG